MKYEGLAPSFPTFSAWHYCGTYFWFRAAEVYKRAWWWIHPSKYGAEAYASGLFPTAAAACKFRITPENYFLPNGVSRLYDADFWNQIGIPTGPDADSYEGSPL
jgi:hypothetical protein